MRCIGCDHAELKTFCGVMNLPPPVHKTSHKAISDTVEEAATSVQTFCMQNAAQKEYDCAEALSDDDCRNIDVSNDGTWMTKGHTSNVGLCTTIGLETGKVLDTEVKTKVCKSCQYWQKQDKTTERYREWNAKHVHKNPSRVIGIDRSRSSNRYFPAQCKAI